VLITNDGRCAAVSSPKNITKAQPIRSAQQLEAEKARWVCVRWVA
jgi:hypothetical protein